MTIAFNHLGKLGQLGNQMFQYAATKGIASKLDVPFMIPVSYTHLTLPTSDLV